MQLSEAVVVGLRHLWELNPPTPTPDGDRIFVRYTDLRPDQLCWDDWQLVGTIREHIPEMFREPFQGDLDILCALHDGQSHGVLDYGLLRVEWCRSILDGPTEERVSDWSEPSMVK